MYKFNNNSIAESVPQMVLIYLSDINHMSVCWGGIMLTFVS